MEEIPTEPVTTVETDVTTVKTEVTNDEITDIEEAIMSSDPPRRKPGRPLGSKSKEPGKPRTPRKKVVIEEAPVAPVAPVEEERVLPGSRPIPTEAHNDTTALMLELLRQQAQQRQTRKADLWKSWFR